MNDIIICRLDGKEMLTKHLARHLKLHHQKDYKEYIKENIDDFKPVWNLCPVCNSLVRGKACPGICLTQYYSQTRMGVSHGPMSDETKKKLSDDKKRKYAKGWAPRVGKLHSEETKLRISVVKKNQLSDPTNHPFYGKHHNPITKKKMSQTRISLGLSKGSNNPMFGKTHTPEAIKKIFSHRKMNKLEKLVADELDKAGIKYTFQFFIVRNGICKSYDFKIKRKPTILEVDGDFWHGNPTVPNHYEKSVEVRKNDKVKTDLANKRGYKVVRLWETDIKANPSIVVESLR